MTTDVRGIASDVTPGQSACVQLLEEVLHLSVREVTQLTIEIVVTSVMVRSCESQVIVAVNIPLAVITLSVTETVRDVTRVQQLVTDIPSVPTSEVSDADDGMGQHHAQVGSLVIQVVSVQFTAQRVLLAGVSYLWVFFMQPVGIVSWVDVHVGPDNVIHCVTSMRFRFALTRGGWVWGNISSVFAGSTEGS